MGEFLFAPAKIVGELFLGELLSVYIPGFTSYNHNAAGVSMD